MNKTAYVSNSISVIWTAFTFLLNTFTVANKLYISRISGRQGCGRRQRCGPWFPVKARHFAHPTNHPSFCLQHYFYFYFTLFLFLLLRGNSHHLHGHKKSVFFWQGQIPPRNVKSKSPPNEMPAFQNEICVI